ncbi:hypothetical protein CCS77_0107 [Campylobacter concisus]|uniref:Uncharacterized protein n=1 Tax=Campylobacter concisus TaxID=199 RepID=A0A2R4NXM7_9BACT|nr:hypothetical protein CCS77_0107 [Campylobacter concisus]
MLHSIKFRRVSPIKSWKIRVKFRLWREKSFTFGFLKYLAGFTSSQRQKRGYQICFYLLNLQEAYHQKFIESAKQI